MKNKKQPTPPKKELPPIKEKRSKVEEVLEKSDSELIAKAIRNILKKDEKNGY